MKREKFYNYLLFAGYFLMILSIILVMENINYGQYLFWAGGLAYLFCRLKSLYRGKDFRLRRLNRMYAFCAILTIGTAWLMYIGNNAWLVLMLLLALVELYVSFRSDYYQKHPE